MVVVALTDCSEQGITTFQRTATLASTFFSLLGIVIGLYHTWEHRIRTNADVDDLVSRNPRSGHRWVIQPFAE
jgi:hypothetical protein